MSITYVFLLVYKTDKCISSEVKWDYARNFSLPFLVTFDTTMGPLKTSFSYCKESSRVSHVGSLLSLLIYHVVSSVSSFLLPVMSATGPLNTISRLAWVGFTILTATCAPCGALRSASAAGNNSSAIDQVNHCQEAWIGFPGGSEVKNPPAVQELQVLSLC